MSCMPDTDREILSSDSLPHDSPSRDGGRLKESSNDCKLQCSQLTGWILTLLFSILLSEIRAEQGQRLTHDGRIKQAPVFIEKKARWQVRVNRFDTGTRLHQFSNTDIAPCRVCGPAFSAAFTGLRPEAVISPV